MRVRPDDIQSGIFRDDSRAAYVVDSMIRRDEIECVHADDCPEAFDHPVQITLERVGH